MKRIDLGELTKVCRTKWGDDGCWPWRTGKRGTIRREGKTQDVCRTMLEDKLGRKIADGMNSCHHCDNPACFNPKHLFEGTQAENIADMMAKGRDRFFLQPGDANQNRKLSASDVLFIRSEFSEGRSTQRELAKRYGVGRGAIFRAIRRITWKTV